MNKVNKLFLVGGVCLLLLLSVVPWLHQRLFAEMIFGISYIKLYCVVSFIIVIGLILFFGRYTKEVIFFILAISFSWILGYIAWKDTVPPKNYIPLSDEHAQYYIEKNSYDYGLCYVSKTKETLCGIIGSSIYPLEKYVHQKIRFVAQWRSDWGKPMCHIEPCPAANRSAVIDILDISLAQ